MKKTIALILACISIFALVSCGATSVTHSSSLYQPNGYYENSNQNATKYETALRYMRQGKYEEAIDAFNELGSYSNAKEYAKCCEAITYCEQGDYELAYEELSDIKYFSEAKEILKNIYYETRLFEGLTDARGMLKNPNSMSIAEYFVSFPADYADSEKSFATPEKPAFTLRLSAQNGFGGFAPLYVLLSENDDGEYEVTYYAKTLDSDDAEDFLDLLNITAILGRYDETDMTNDYIDTKRVDDIVASGNFTRIKRIPELEYSDFAE